MSRTGGQTDSLLLVFIIISAYSCSHPQPEPLISLSFHQNLLFRAVNERLFGYFKYQQLVDSEEVYFFISSLKHLMYSLTSLSQIVRLLL